ncbi:Heme-binding protein 2 [Cichlidogyrus casuarinus]|uniref:Heme-binding protein 2 n=1 Tax=Cichlidogyrus casuarinus TaxID=1844966 RepID=A0ABD2QC21_9PLAT
MTTPVVVDILPDAKQPLMKLFRFSFFVDPKQFPKGPPKPNDKAVYIRQEPERYWYAHKYGGFSNDRIFKEEASVFRVQLNSLGLKIDPEGTRFAAYDPPFKVLNRRNEVLFPAILNENSTVATTA